MRLLSFQRAAVRYASARHRLWCVYELATFAKQCEGRLDKLSFINLEWPAWYNPIHWCRVRTPPSPCPPSLRVTFYALLRARFSECFAALLSPSSALLALIGTAHHR